MRKLKLMLNQIELAKKFNSIVTQYDFDMDIERDRYIVDAKSVLGLFSLDLSKPIILAVYTDDEDVLTELTNKLQDAGIEIQKK